MIHSSTCQNSNSTNGHSSATTDQRPYQRFHISSFHKQQGRAEQLNSLHVWFSELSRTARSMSTRTGILCVLMTHFIMMVLQTVGILGLIWQSNTSVTAFVLQKLVHTRLTCVVGTPTTICINLIMPETRDTGIRFCCCQYASIFIQMLRWAPKNTLP